MKISRTTSKRTRLLALLAPVVLMVPVAAGARALAEEPGAAVAEPRPNGDPAYLQVYDANVENLPTTDEQPPAECAGDWHDLMYYMRTQELKPDVYLVQQLNNKEQLDLLLDRMESHFGEKYAGVLAENDPEPTTGGGCNPFKKRQTNAVIWRTDRLELVKSASPKNRWQAQKWDGEDCVPNHQPRTKGVKALLLDRISGKTVTAASFHWPTMTTGEDCARNNAGELSNELTEDGYDSHGEHGDTDLYIAGGDANAHDTGEGGAPDGQPSPWHKAVNGDAGGELGFRDAVYAHCETTDDPRACKDDRWTLEVTTKRRVDYLLGRKPGGAMPEMSSVVVPTFEDGNEADEEVSQDGDSPLVYSDHRAVGARVHY